MKGRNGSGSYNNLTNAIFLPLDYFSFKKYNREKAIYVKGNCDGIYQCERSGRQVGAYPKNDNISLRKWAHRGCAENRERVDCPQGRR
jgi:hypothetical protein